MRNGPPRDPLPAWLVGLITVVGTLALGACLGAVFTETSDEPEAPPRPSPTVVISDPYEPVVTPTSASPTQAPSPSDTGPVITGGGSRTVTAGAYCSPVGATGKTRAGTTLTCIRRSGESRGRWRKG